MSIMWQRFVLVGGALLLSACASLEGDNILVIATPNSAVKPEIKNAAVLRILPYTDERLEKSPRLLGVATAHVIGMTSKQLQVDRDLAEVVTSSLRQQFAKAGFEVASDTTQAAKFELSGKVKQLTLDVKDRDEVNLAVETTVKDLATGQVIWSAVVNEKNDRFAGVSGNTKSDVVDYLQRELRVVSSKTVDAVNTLLMAAYPAFFNLTPGTKTIAGVTVNTAPVLTAAQPVASVPVLPTPASTQGMLQVSSQPARAKVYVDEVYFGLTPLNVNLDAGVHTLSLKQTGYKTATEKVSVRKGEQTELEIQLER